MKTIVFFICIFSQLVWAQTEEKKEKNTANAIETFSPKSSGGWVYGVGLTKTLNSNLKFYTTDINNGPNLGSTEFPTTNIFSLDFEARNLAQKSWGFIGGLTIDIGENSIETGTLSSNLGKVTVRASASPVSLKTNVLYANAAYRWNQFYIPFGLNLMSTKSKSESCPIPISSNNEYCISGFNSSHGYIGVQFGIGYYFYENLIVETYVRSVAINMFTWAWRPDAGNYHSQDFTDGYLSSLMITTKYIF